MAFVDAVYRRLMLAREHALFLSLQRALGPVFRWALAAQEYAREALDSALARQQGEGVRLDLVAMLRLRFSEDAPRRRSG